MPVEEITVLACSKKWGGKCVAGISKSTGEWVRPVSDLPRKQLTPYHCRIDGRLIQPLDVIRFEHRGALNESSQPENVEVEDTRWQLTGRVDPVDAYGELSPYLVQGPALFGNRGAAVPEEEAAKGVESSLALVEPEKVEFVLERPWQGSGRPRPHVVFALSGHRYDLALTDYLVRPRLMDAGYGNHDLSDLALDPDRDVLLTVSLAEAEEGWCTKLVAAVLLLPRHAQRGLRSV